MSMDISTNVSNRRAKACEWCKDLRSIEKMCNETVRTQKVILEDGLEKGLEINSVIVTMTRWNA